MYSGAPETYRSHKSTESAPLQVTNAVDMWSIGCVFSEVAVWAHYGWKRVHEYRRQRSAEIEVKGRVSGEQIFHWDESILEAVDGIHQDMLQKSLSKDLITRSVLDRLVGDLLQHGSRPHAKQVFEKSKRLVNECERRFGVSVVEIGGGSKLDSDEATTWTRSPPQEHRRSHARRDSSLEQPRPPDDSSKPSSSSSTTQSSRHRHHHKSPSQSSNARSIHALESSQPSREALPIVYHLPLSPPDAANTHENSSQQHLQQPQEGPVRPTLSVDDGHAWKEKKKSGGVANLHGDENLTSLDRRDHVSLVLYKVELADRWVQIFLIDNSATMKQYKENIERVISLLAYMVKGSDKDGLDIFFTQTARKINSQRSSKLSTSIRQVQFVGVPDMRGRLQSISQEHINKFGTTYQPPKPLFGRQPPPEPQKPLSFYILTDAKWQPTDVGGLIKDLVKSMIDKKCPKEHVAIQFIRFGGDQASIDKLDELDHGLGLKAIGM